MVSVRTAAAVVAVFAGVLDAPGGRVVLAQEDSWRPGAAMPQARARAASCVLDQRIHVIGGSSVGGGAGTTDNQEYNPATDSWRLRSPLPTPRLAASGNAVNGRCHVLGGSFANVPRRGLDTHEIYDPLLNTWSTGAAMPTARYAHASAVLDGKIWVIGGTPDGAVVLGNVEIYDPSTDSWSTGPSINQPRGTHTADVNQGRIYIAGGTRAATDQQYATLEMYDPASQQWTLLAEMPTARWELASAAIQGRLFTVGGAVFLSAETALEEYDPLSDLWSIRADLPAPAFRTMAESVEGKLYVFGGLTQALEGHPANDDTWIYTPLTVAPSTRINAGFNDAWYNPATNGQGFLISVFPAIGQVFLAWFTFDIERPPEELTAQLGEPGHRWLTAQGPYDGDVASLTVFLTEGGVFNAAEPPASTDVAGDGSMTIEFENCERGLITYEITSLNLSGMIPIQRIVPDRVPLCEALVRP